MNFTNADRQAGRKAMEKSLTVAAEVRREFRSGRPPKVNDQLPLHPNVVWKRAMDALSAFREKMTAAKLKAKDASAAIVYIEAANQDMPCFLLLEEKGKSAEQMQRAAFEQLMRPDVIALGMLFKQFDAEKKQQSIFPYFLMGLNERGMAVLRKAAEMQNEGTALTKNVS